MPEPAGIDGLLRELAPQVLGAVARRSGDFDGAEDAVQEALLEAASTWPDRGLPRDPRAWLVTVARRRLLDAWRSESARRAREDRVHEEPEPDVASGRDDSLELLLLCCHPAIARPAQVALTLRAVGGLRTVEIARAMLLPEPTVGQRISRAKKAIRDSGATFALPGPDELPERIDTVATVLYLIFTEGHTATSGPLLQRVDLTAEAIRLTRMLHARTSDGEIAGLLALMLLTAARTDARLDDNGALVPLDRQDRIRWDRAQIAEGTELVEAALRDGPVGPYQLQAAIAAVHAEAPTYADTDWPQILALYDLLRAVAPGPMVTLNRVVALAMAAGERAALLELDVCAADPALAGHHRVPAVRAHLLERAGEHTAAAQEYRAAARRTPSDPERRYLLARAASLG